MEIANRSAILKSLQSPALPDSLIITDAYSYNPSSRLEVKLELLGYSIPLME